MSQRILIIEDDSTLGELLQARFEKEGYQVTLIPDGAAGFATMRVEKPDAVLLDILMPSMNGYEVLEAKKNDPTIKDIPVIIISNSGQPVEIGRTFELGAKDYLVKAQFTPDEVLAKLRRILPVSSQPQTSLQHKKILVVEDDAFLGDVLMKKLAFEGCDAVRASSGEEALQKMAESVPELVLLDLLLPGMSGFDILEHIKKTEATKMTSVIVLSNLSQKEDKDRARNLGAATFMVKAMSTPDDILTEMRRVLA